MKTIYYKVTFLTWWHCGSGQAAGPDVDELAIKDSEGLPYIPGRTMKGLLKDSCRQMAGYGLEGMDSKRINSVFGYHDDTTGSYSEKGSAFFSDVVLPASDRRAIAADKGLRKALFSSVAATAIGNDGIAKDHTLRKIQVTVPCALYGMIANVGDDDTAMLAQAMKFIKRVGLGRNHGLGRCKIEIIETKEG